MKHKHKTYILEHEGKERKINIFMSVVNDTEYDLKMEKLITGVKPYTLTEAKLCDSDDAYNIQISSFLDLDEQDSMESIKEGLEQILNPKQEMEVRRLVYNV